MTLKFTASAGELAGAVRYAARWLPARPAVPIYAGLLLEVADGCLSVTGMNENATGQARLDVQATGGQRGAFVVSGRLLDQLVGTFGDKPVTFEQVDSIVAISTGRWRGTLPLMSAKDYPSLPARPPLAGHIDGDVLADALQRVGSAASRDLTNQVELTGVRINFDELGEQGGHTLTLLATDRYRAARMVVPWEPGPDRAPAGDASLVPASVLVDAANDLAGHGLVAIGRGGGAFGLSTPSRSLVVRVMDSTKVPAAGLMALFERKTTAEVTMAIKALVVPLKRTELLASGASNGVHSGAGGLGGVFIRLTRNLMTIGVQGDNSGDDDVDVTYDGPDATLLMRATSMQGVMHSAPGDTITMAFVPNENPPGPAVVTAPADPAWRHILVPLRKV